MYSATFTLEAITPVFMRGANQSKAEIRAASIKGLMRWWFRALSGSYFGDDIKGLREAEGKVFGSAGSTGSRKSGIGVFMDEVESSTIYEPGNPYEKYFWFSQVERYSKPAILPKTPIKITIESHSERLMKLSLLAFWFALHLGGFGSRSRKFAGSIFPVEEPDTDIDFKFKFLPPDDKGSLANYYSETIGVIIKELVETLETYNFKRGRITAEASYPVFSPSTSNVFIGPLSDSFSNVIKDIGEWYLGARKGSGFSGGVRFKYADRKIPHRLYDKYKKGEKNIKGLPATGERRPFLGIPIQFYRRFDKEYVRFSIDFWSTSRRASSLIMTVNKAGEKFYPVITVFKYAFLPNYSGPVRISGGVYRNRNRVASIGGALHILKKGEDPKTAYINFWNEIIRELKLDFEEVFP